MRKFTFGRKYNKGWRTFDLDYEKMYSNVPNPCAKVLLTRQDMTRLGLRKSLALIDVHDFTTMTRVEFARAEVVVFLDDDGSIKILKKRY